MVLCFILESYAWYHSFTCGSEQCCDQLRKLNKLSKVMVSDGARTLDLRLAAIIDGCRGITSL